MNNPEVEALTAELVKGEGAIAARRIGDLFRNLADNVDTKVNDIVYKQTRENSAERFLGINLPKFLNDNPKVLPKLFNKLHYDDDNQQVIAALNIEVPKFYTGKSALGNDDENFSLPIRKIRVEYSLDLKDARDLERLKSGDAVYFSPESFEPEKFTPVGLQITAGFEGDLGAANTRTIPVYEYNLNDPSIDSVMKEQFKNTANIVLGGAIESTKQQNAERQRQMEAENNEFFGENGKYIKGLL